MRLDIKATALAMGILWGVAALLTGLVNILRPGYGSAFLQMLASIYPGYDATGSLGDVVTGVLYALVDGLLFGLIFAWLYNRFQGPPQAISGDDKKASGVRYRPVEPGA